MISGGIAPFNPSEYGQMLQRRDAHSEMLKSGIYGNTVRAPCCHNSKDDIDRRASWPRSEIEGKGHLMYRAECKFIYLK